ncbi:UDP-N-acetylmuramoyl-L-alanyl-D-glutamate--2,6-diaminopimelate ligase [Halobacillus sp. A1]|uniref:UDP-N-acetylmuramoyl-L-alanyl-D-glutamate--2, 6-diaminopimelate ligase n=1 Tax=Halobacillus sp. A1 TaxID=2880262 RepID=UPI0020A6401E|nr:UDP-N-acetylmuramoyl-L-alanyl-D-glutamate--2,6-diaminopimelate ligase [Halobacillus sp. A1]MCP3031751.1 UDP-N-acetylmuramoyl-L-alanyl-D-glutamate--2,6-diaminopimelate ligase [Halobacillus sp. A1]
MKLNQLLENIPFENEKPLADPEIKGLTDSSSEVEPGYIFIAITGYQSDGHSYITDAIKKGASAIIGEKDAPECPIPYIKVQNSKKALGTVSAIYYQNPSHRKKMIGITGTNGKTTTSYMVKHVLEDIGYSCSLIGTIQNIVNGEKFETNNTTPNALRVNELLADSTDDVVIMEASSQGLAEYRLEGIEFDLCLFTNLSNEHLNYHGSLDNYFEAKKQLFYKLKHNGTAIINVDDFYGEKLAEELHQKGMNIYTFGESRNADLQMNELNLTHPYSVHLKENGEKFPVVSPIPGYHNLYNTTIAYAAAKAFFGERQSIIDSLEKFPGVEGRFNIYRLPNGVTTVIDHAHTADAVLNCLQTASDSKTGRLVHVFGFKGQKDMDKRKEMIKISAEISDQYILTLDDLNNVPENEMIEHLNELQNEYGNDKGKIMKDRTLAIEEAIRLSEEGDWVAITGKGHQSYQQTYAYSVQSDKECIQLFLSKNTE